MAGAPLENTNAEKWTYEDALELYSKAFDLSEDTEWYVVGKESLEGYKYDFIGELIDALRIEYKALNKKVYRRLISDHLPDRFPEFKSEYNELKEKMEINCYSNTKKGIINTAAGIINLKSNHHWKDRSSNEVEVTEKRIFESIDLDVKEDNSPV